MGLSLNRNNTLGSNKFSGPFRPQSNRDVTVATMSRNTGDHDFKSFWKREFPECAPLSFLFRERYPDHWLRFHNLPETKRYAETGAERKEVMVRLNTIGTRVLGVGRECWLVAAYRPFWRDVEKRRDGKGQYAKDRLEMNFEFELDFFEDWIDEPLVFSVFSKRCVWKECGYNRLLKNIAEDFEGHVFWVSMDAIRIFAPYDGGADLILRSSEEVRDLGVEFENWLSPEESGL